MKKKKLKSKKKKQGRTKSNLAKRELTPVEQERVESEFVRASYFMQAGNLHQAAEAYRSALRIDPKHARSINMLSAIALKDGQPDQAVKFSRMAIQINPDNPGYYNNLGLALMERNQPEEAVAAFQKALQKKPDYFDALNNLGNALKRLGNVDEAIDCYRKALKMQPDDPDILNNLGSACKDQGNIDAAIEYYQRALEHNPSGLESYQNLARLFIKANRLAEARQTVKSNVKLAGGNQAKLLLATIEFREGNYKIAGDTVEELCRSDLLPADQREAQFLAANISHKMGDYDAAFQKFNQANQGVQEQEKDEIQKRIIQQSRDFSFNPRPLLAWISKESIAGWQKYPENDGLPAPVFLVGFPRSGTTLLDQMLQSHSAILTLEEKNTLQQILKDFCHPKGRDLFTQLNNKRIAEYRSGYWKLVARYLGLPEIQEGKVIIDRNPFNTSYLGLICRFFPEARIIVALRDPRDVCLSCFMQDFTLNNAVCNFLSLKATARYYATTMDMLLHFRQLLPLTFHYVHYENLIADVEQEAKKIIHFLGLAWEDKILQYHETAKARYITTASHHQVVKPLYKSAVGRWRKYEQYLQPILPILEPYVEIFEAERKKSKESLRGW